MIGRRDGKQSEVLTNSELKCKHKVDPQFEL